MQMTAIARGAIHEVRFPLVSQLLNHLLHEGTACTWYSYDVAWRMHWRVLKSSHISSGWRWRLLFQLPPTVKCVCDKVFECTEHSADRNLSHWTPIRRVPVLTKLIGVLFVAPSVIRANAVLDLHYHDPFKPLFIKFINYKC